MMATSAIGTLPKFNPEDGQDVASYVEIIELFCEANNIAEEKQKVAVFLTAAGPKAYENLRHHCTPKLPKEKTFQEIVTIFKQLFGSNTSQHSSSQAKGDESTQDPEGQATTEVRSTESAQPLAHEKKPFTFKEAAEKVVSEIKKNQESQNLQSASDRWEHALTHETEELMALQELGLGVAIDITAKHPWVSKSAFQAKPVKREELIVVNESNKSHRSREQVETYTSIQQGLESSFRPDPTTPINVTVAADFHRSDTRSKTINSETTLTRTVAFHAKDPLGKSRDKKDKEEFEKNLHEWLVKKKCYPVVCGTKGHAKSYEHGLYSETTNHHCIDYLKELGGVTHYVSSITLGATSYQVTSNSTLFNSISSSSEVSAHTFASASTKSKVSRKVFQSHSKEQHIGKLPGTGNILQFRTKGEAVVKCSYNSLANLVSHPQLRKLLEMGINEYIDLKKNGTRGPYHITTAELFPSKKSEGDRERLYWTIKWKSPVSITKRKDKDSSGKDSQEDHSSSKNRQEDHSSSKDRQEDHSSSKDCQEDHSSSKDRQEDHCSSKDHQEEHSLSNDHQHSSSNKRKTEDNRTVVNSYTIVCTPIEEEASNFYLKPIVQCGDDKYFWIVTDPEDFDKQSSEKRDTHKIPVKEANSSDEGQAKSKPQAEDRHNKPNERQGLSHDQLEPQSDSCIPESKRKLEPQRYVSVYKKDLVVALNVDPHSAKKSAFKLKNPRDDQTYPLHKSQWLPEALRGSQPYYIGGEGKRFRRSGIIKKKKTYTTSVYIEDHIIMFGEHENDYGFFILEPGHKT